MSKLNHDFMQLAIEKLASAKSDVRKIGGFITPKTANRLLENYKKKEGVVRGMVFGSDILLDVLSRPDTKGIRFYFGIDEKGNHKLVACAVDNQMNDIIPDSEDGDWFDKIFDLAQPCPTLCGDVKLLSEYLEHHFNDSAVSPTAK